jgi:hypothetical protein
MAESSQLTATSFHCSTQSAYRPSWPKGGSTAPGKELRAFSICCLHSSNVAAGMTGSETGRRSWWDGSGWGMSANRSLKGNCKRNHVSCNRLRGALPSFKMNIGKRMKVKASQTDPALRRQQNRSSGEYSRGSARSRERRRLVRDNRPPCFAFTIVKWFVPRRAPPSGASDARSNFPEPVISISIRSGPCDNEAHARLSVASARKSKPFFFFGRKHEREPVEIVVFSLVSSSLQCPSDAGRGGVDAGGAATRGGALRMCGMAKILNVCLTQVAVKSGHPPTHNDAQIASDSPG